MIAPVTPEQLVFAMLKFAPHIILLACCTMAPVAVVRAADAPSDAPAIKEIYWVFLNKGEGRTNLANMAKEQVSVLQSNHVGNLGALYKAGRAFTAGPLGDNGFIRGIVVLNVTTPEAVADCFKPDPFVQQNILSVEAYPWIVDTSRFHEPLEPFKMAQHTLGVVKKGPAYKAPAEAKESRTIFHLLPSLKAQSDAGELAVSGPLVKAGDLLGILLFKSSETNTVRSILDKDPAVKEGRVVVELHPQFMGAGVLR
jgi:uncharacterized protein YciI